MDGRAIIDCSGNDFDQEMLRFYEEYMAVMEGSLNLFDSRFALRPDTARGFFIFMDKARALTSPPVAVKGQVTGPITFTIGAKDQSDRSIFYDDQIRDAAVKLLAMKAKWQVRQLAAIGSPVIIFIDEPALAGFGSSEMISIAKADVISCLNEVVAAIQSEGGLAGIHVCANTDWSMVTESLVDMINFDAYGYFDRFILYEDAVRSFFDSGRFLAWGLVPTLVAEDINKETTDTLLKKWEGMVTKLESMGIARDELMTRSLITPSCGTGSLSVKLANRVLELTRDLSLRIRNTN
jgi:methionine synthase II (cobalamin-independent)